MPLSPHWCSPRGRARIRLMSAGGVERRLAAILSADVVGYSRLMAADESGTVRRITAYREQVGAFSKLLGRKIVIT